MVDQERIPITVRFILDGTLGHHISPSHKKFSRELLWNVDPNFHWSIPMTGWWITYTIPPLEIFLFCLFFFYFNRIENPHGHRRNMQNSTQTETRALDWTVDPGAVRRQCDPLHTIVTLIIAYISLPWDITTRRGVWMQHVMGYGYRK